MVLLQISHYGAALFLLAHKILLLLPERLKKVKSFTWIVAMIGVILAITYFILLTLRDQNKWIMIVPNVALIPSMIFGHFVLQKQEDEQDEKKKRKVRRVKILSIAVAAAASLFLAIYMATERHVSSYDARMQFFYCLFLLVGTLLMASNANTTRVFGWLSYLGMHIICAILLWEPVGFPIFGTTQVISAFLAVYGIYKEINKILNHRAIMKKRDLFFKTATLVFPTFIEAHEHMLGGRAALALGFNQGLVPVTGCSVHYLGTFPPGKAEEKEGLAIKKIRVLQTRNSADFPDVSSFQTEDETLKQYGGGVRVGDCYYSASGFPPHLDQKFIIAVLLVANLITMKDAAFIEELTYEKQKNWFEKVSK